MAKLSGLLATSDPELGALTAASRNLRTADVPALAVEGPAALRPFLAAALAGGQGASGTALTDGGRTVLAVTATDREAEDLAAAAGTCSVATPSPCCPAGRRCRTSGCRRARTPSAAGCRSSGASPTRTTAPRLVVAAARSLIQPIAPGLGRLEPVTLRVGDTHDFDGLLVRLVELAYTRVEMVTARGEFAVRGGIVDIFPPTAEHPVRVEFWGDEVSELRSFAVADQRSVAPVEELHAPGVPGAAAHRRGARPGRGARPDPREQPRPCASCWSASPRASRPRAWSR